MATKLLAAARKLPPGPDRHNILQEMGDFAAQTVTSAKRRSRSASPQAEGEGEMSDLRTLDPTPELPDDTPIGDVEFPARIRNVLATAGLNTVGEVREISDETLLSFQDFGKGSLAYLRETLGLPSTDGVRPSGKKPA